ncbi:MAG TPA: hypothetical protein VGL56_04595 [Fimbriimonadaceae bacterium]|jgi:hypothetical protein
MPHRYIPRLRLALAATLTLGLLAPCIAQTYKVKQDNGIWWFESPKFGKLWSFAVDVVETGQKGAADNPSYDAMSIFPGEQSWVEAVLGQFKDWGINSIGAWSADDLFKKYSPEGQRLPYFAVLHLGSYNKAPWNDLFAPETEKLTMDAAKKLIPPLKDDPYLVGYYTDNELGWWDDSLFKWYFAMPATAPGKIKLVHVLKDYYGGNYAKLLADWDCSAGSFDGLLQQTKIFLKPGTTGVKAVHAFNRALTDRYYSMVNSEVRAIDKNHLILGDRYAQYYNLETIAASKPYIDVVSTNAGAAWLDGSYSHFFFQTLYNVTQKPIVITEFYFAARENSMGNRNSGEGFPTVQTQAERAKGFGNCVRALASLPFVVGAQWFQYYDEPPKGRGDGEDFNMGLVDVKGKPYADMVHTAASLHPAELHAKAEINTYDEVPLAPASPMDGLLHWDRERGYLPSTSGSPWSDLYICHDKDNLYVGLYAMEFMDDSLYADGKFPEIDRPRLDMKIGDFNVMVRYDGKNEKATCSVPDVTVSEKISLSSTVILKIPYRLLGGLGRAVHVTGTLSSHGRGYKMGWDRDPKLD